MRLAELPFSKKAVVMHNNRGRTPLHLAAQRNDVKGAIKLLDAGACVDDKDNVSHVYTCAYVYCTCTCSIVHVC